LCFMCVASISPHGLILLAGRLRTAATDESGKECAQTSPVGG
jgi:hypothetical protein